MSGIEVKVAVVAYPDFPGGPLIREGLFRYRPESEEPWQYCVYDPIEGYQSRGCWFTFRTWPRMAYNALDRWTPRWFPRKALRQGAVELLDRVKSDIARPAPPRKVVERLAIVFEAYGSTIKDPVGALFRKHDDDPLWEHKLLCPIYRALKSGAVLCGECILRKVGEVPPYCETGPLLPTAHFMTLVCAYPAKGNLADWEIRLAAGARRKALKEYLWTVGVEFRGWTPRAIKEVSSASL